MANIIATVRSTPKRMSVALATLAAVIAIPATLYAWGPERPTYTINNPADHVTFNSITNNPNIGDERNFVGIRESGTTGLWQDSQTVQPGKEYVVRMYVHNNAADNLNLVAENVTAKFNLPTTTGTSIQVNGFLNSSNAQPVEVYDHATFKASENFNLAYVAGSAKYYNNANGNGFTIPETLFTSTGAKLGYTKMDGKIPGCFQYAGYLTFIVKPQFAAKSNYTMEKLVSKHGENKWSNDYVAQPGETVDFLLKYKNTGDVQHDNVTFRDTLPADMSYVSSSTKYGNSKFPQGTAASDNITGAGINAGSYAPGANAWVIFSAKVAAKDNLECGLNTLRNVASVTPGGQTPKEDDATVKVDKHCEDKPEPEKIKVCDTKNNQIVTIDKSTYEADKDRYTTDLTKCEDKPEVEKIKVCLVEDKKIVTIDKKDFDDGKHSTDLSKCEEAPEVPEELPRTGATDNILAALGLGATVTATVAYIPSRKNSLVG